jgi:hypothetical protein
MKKWLVISVNGDRIYLKAGYLEYIKDTGMSLLFEEQYGKHVAVIPSTSTLVLVGNYEAV